MKKSSLICKSILAIAGALLLQSNPVFADVGMPPPPGAMMEHGHQFDWIAHTQHTLDELKGKLNLAPEQMTAWDAWSHGVIKDSQQQLDQKKVKSDEKRGSSKNSIDETTPEQMARGIERLRAETNWMQEHLIQLEAAQVRTLAFYNILGTNQKTIFDLFWHEMYHRISGHDDGGDMREHEHVRP
jgi:hypothetical protein